MPMLKMTDEWRPLLPSGDISYRVWDSGLVVLSQEDGDELGQVDLLPSEFAELCKLGAESDPLSELEVTGYKLETESEDGLKWVYLRPSRVDPGQWIIRSNLGELGELGEWTGEEYPLPPMKLWDSAVEALAYCRERKAKS